MNETDFEAAQDALDADEQPDESIRDWIIKFYTEFNPEKLGSVDVILSKYVGREDELVRQLERKYAPIAAGDEPAPAPAPRSASPPPPPPPPAAAAPPPPEPEPEAPPEPPTGDAALDEARVALAREREASRAVAGENARLQSAHAQDRRAAEASARDRDAAAAKLQRDLDAEKAARAKVAAARDSAEANERSASTRVEALEARLRAADATNAEAAAAAAAATLSCIAKHKLLVRTVEEQQELTYHLKAATETIATYFPPDFEAEIAAQLIAQDALYAEDAARAAMDAEAAGYPETKDDDDDASDDPDAPALPPPEEPPAVRGGLKPPLLAALEKGEIAAAAPPLARDPDGDASDAAGRDGITGRAYAKMYASARQQMARMTRERNNAERRVLEYAQLNNALEEELALHRAELEQKAGAADGARSESDGLRADLEAARAARGRLEAALAKERAAHEATRRDLQEAEAVVDVAAEARREQERWFDEQRRRCEDEAQELVDRAVADSSMLQEELLTRELKNMEARKEMVDAQVKVRDEEIQRLSELVANLDANVKARDRQVETMQAELHKAAKAFLQHEKDIVARAPKAIGGGGLVDDDDGAAGDAPRRDDAAGDAPRREDAAGDAPLPSLPAAYPDETPPVHGPPLPPNFERKLDL